jgi:hypothetical protein
LSRPLVDCSEEPVEPTLRRTLAWWSWKILLLSIVSNMLNAYFIILLSYTHRIQLNRRYAKTNTCLPHYFCNPRKTVFCPPIGLLWNILNGFYWSLQQIK